MVSVRAVHRAKCECEFVDGSRIECERLTCEFNVSVVCGGILFGIVSEDTVMGTNWLEDERCLNRVWYYASPLCQFFNGPKKIQNRKSQSEDKPKVIQTGDVVTIEIDLPLKCATFFVNSIVCGKVNFSCEAVRPAVYFFAKGSSVRVTSLVLKTYEVFERDSLLQNTQDIQTSAKDSWERCHACITTSSSETVIHNEDNQSTPAFSCALRKPGHLGPCSAVLTFFASTKWISRTCTGKRLTAEFEIRERTGSMDIGVVTSAVSESGTWCDPALVKDAYWYCWSGALRRGCELKLQTGRRFFKGDAVRVEVDLHLGNITFVLNDEAVGSLMVEAVVEVRRLEEWIFTKRRELLSEMAAIASLKAEAHRGRFALVKEVNRRVAATGKDQADLLVAAERLRALASGCDVRLYPAVALCGVGDEVLVDGSIAFQAQECSPADNSDALAQVPDLERATEPLPLLPEEEFLALARRVREALGQTGSPLLDLLTAEELDRLADGYVLRIEAGCELRASSGEEPASVYVLLDGLLSVSVSGAAGPREVAVLDQPGRAFGELAGALGKRFKARVLAVGQQQARVFEVSRELLLAVLAERGGQALAAFQAQTERRVTANAMVGDAWKSMFLLYQHLHVHA